MAFNILSSSAIIFFCLVLFQFCLLFCSILAHPNVQKDQFPFEFIKHLQGCKKGDKIIGIHNLKKYLHHFGYLDRKHVVLNSWNSNDVDRFDKHVEMAIKIYQLNFNLNITGVLDQETVSKMMLPRCGVPDIVNGTTRMNAARVYNGKYAFFVGSPKWPLSKKVLSWSIKPGTRRDVIKPLSEFSFVSWNAVTPFSYNFVDENLTSTDIKIQFGSRSTGDPRFDGRWGVLAFARAPTDGNVFFDGDENWSDGAAVGAVDMGTVGLHELGHVLGLQHSSLESAVMYPYLPINAIKGLDDDDIKGMQALYGTS